MTKDNPNNLPIVYKSDGTKSSSDGKKEHKKRSLGGKTEAEHKEMVKIIRQYFNADISPYTCSQRSEHHIDTVTKYYKQWTDQIQVANNKNHMEREDATVAQMVQVYDNDILENTIILTEIERAKTQWTTYDDFEVEKAKEKGGNRQPLFPHALEKRRQEIAKLIMEAKEKKSALLMTPTTSVVITKFVEKEMTKVTDLQDKMVE